MTVPWMDGRLYPDFDSNWDDEMFRKVLLSHLKPTDRVLDLGAGAGIVEQMNVKGLVGQACGVDLDERVLTNPYLDDAQVGTAERIPYEDGAFDLVFSDNVLEHLEHPDVVFREVARVLKPGGVFLVKTPNRFHYVAFLARVTPHRFHQWVNRLRGRKEVDTFPTRYRANSERDLRRLGAESGLTLANLTHVEGRPEYLRMNALTYAFGWVYERTVNRSERLANLRVLLIGEFRKR